MSHDDGYPAWTWYGANPDTRHYGIYDPPVPTCVDCDRPIDPDLGDEDGYPSRCPECQEGEDESVKDDQARRMWNRQHGFPEDGSGR